MLQRLDISNIALIEKLSVELGEGFNVLTGETGAGKSIIIDSINAILGERLPKDLIRSGEDKASVQAAFDINNEKFSDIAEAQGIELEEDGTLLISRDIMLSGKNSCRINGRLVTLSILKEVGARLLDIHGQYDNQSLLNVSKHSDMLDAFSGAELLNVKDEYQVLYNDFKILKQKYKELTTEKGERERKIDLLSFQVNEISEARIKLGEDLALEHKKLIMGNAEKISSGLASTYGLLREDDESQLCVETLITNAISELGTIKKLDSKYENIASKLDETLFTLQEIIYEIRDSMEDVEYNSDVFDEICERLDMLYKLKRKYGKTLEEVITFGENASNELEQLQNSDIEVGKLTKQLEETSNRLFLKAQTLNKMRLQFAEMLDRQICEELAEMEMKRAKFKTNIVFSEERDGEGNMKFNRNGLDSIEFLISANPGEPLRPLAKIASGGEMSRIMLAIKRILAGVDGIPTLIFDEIDTGISGKAAQKVGEKLSFISKGHQVLCVTHLAQIAAMSDNHFKIEKSSDETRTFTNVTLLDETGKIDEISRLLGGVEGSQITKSHAEEMLMNAKSFKTM